MDFLNISKQIPVDVNLKLSTDNSFFGCGPAGELPIIAVSVSENTCCSYYNTVSSDESMLPIILHTWAFREAERGIQYYDGCQWMYFSKDVQEQWSNYIADKIILEDE